MKIKSLTLSGFKSFADPTAVEFHGGITAIVGPNGCGKSNISDALRWVLGEQRASAIRGSRMDEAIFHGTASRKPIHRAEVELRIANPDGVLPVPYPEVAIGRTVLRGGESVYELNGQAVRLRDIHDLCRDTGLGANAYSIIESKMIDAILSDRPEERRALFEEAAEIGRYKDRRRTALRRLEQATSDLTRLDDVIGEVATKVRSLARQRGRATRYGELRQRRLILEVAVAVDRLAAMQARLDEAERELDSVRRTRPEEEAELAREEAEVEALRLRLIEEERERGRVAQNLEQVRTQLEGIERDRLLATERRASARARLEEIRREQQRQEPRISELAAEIEQAQSELVRCDAEVGELRESETRQAEAVGELRDRRQSLESRESEARTDLTRVLGEIAALGAELEGRKQRSEARGSEVSRLTAELDQLRGAASELDARRSELESRAAATAAAHADAENRFERERDALRASREEARQLRDRLAEAEGQQASVAARAGALESTLGTGRDLPNVVSRLLEDQGEIGGIFGTLASFLDTPAELATAVESQLGPLLHAVLVDDWPTVERVSAWLAGHSDAEGLLLLPLDPGPVTDGLPTGELADRITATGPAAGWARALLGGFDVADPPLGRRDAAWVGVDGSFRDRRGVVRVGPLAGGRGVLRRRAELQELEDRRSRLDDELRVLRESLDEHEAAAHGLAAEVVRLDGEREQVAAAARAASAELEASVERRDRAGRQVAELSARLAALDQERPDDADQGDARGRLTDLKSLRADLESGLAGCGGELLDVTARWEDERDRLQELRLSLARLEATRDGATGRLRRLQLEVQETRDQGRRLDDEATRQRAAIEQAEETLTTTEGTLEELFETRARLEADVRGRIEGLETQRSEIGERETKLRAARARERDISEKRHALELEVTGLLARRASVRERVEAEWEKSLDDLARSVERPGEGSVDEWSAELTDVREKLSRLGPVNMLATEEYDEQKERLDFLESQKADLVEARDDLHDSIDRINETASSAFTEVFEQVRENFREIFVTLFEGGQCDVWLEDPSDPLDSPIEISASPKGKRTQRIHLLSGGERTLTALGLLFAIYLAKPSPFCVMDEVDAPLDESNIGRFTAMLERFSTDTQFLVITHNARTIEVADFIYGVTMQEPGVSTLVALDIHELPKAVAM